jgi:hypothetical protein
MTRGGVERPSVVRQSPEFLRKHSQSLRISNSQPGVSVVVFDWDPDWNVSQTSGKAVEQLIEIGPSKLRRGRASGESWTGRTREYAADNAPSL